jgi:N-acyl amino acid synthase of PEP-CTERM/exosortase system
MMASAAGRIFAENFSIRLARDEASRDRVARVRYQVYCDELGFQLDQQDGREMDSYDSHSLLCLLQHRASGLDAGCIRLVLPAPADGGLPFEPSGLPHIDRSRLDLERLNRLRSCEVSRLAMTPRFRGELEQRGSSIDRRCLPMVSMSLYHAAIALILGSDLQSVFMVNEVRLQRLLQRMGIHLRQVSDEFDYYGRRAVFFTDRAQLLTEMQGWRSDWLSLFEEVCRQLEVDGEAILNACRRLPAPRSSTSALAVGEN